jgi:hypothetical protein
MVHPYSSASYSNALRDGAAIPLAIPEWDSYVLVRAADAGGQKKCATGLYPFACLAPTANLSAGLHRLRNHGVVSVVLVTDPLWQPALDSLKTAFSVCQPLKVSYIIDREKAIYFHKTHRRRIRKAHQQCQIQIVPLGDYLEEWFRLYQGLVRRKEIAAARDFSRSYFQNLARMEALTAVAAFVRSKLVAMSLWIRHSETVYCHLSASSATGYACSASYGAHDFAIQHFRDCRYIILGGVAGFVDSPDDGLASFKRGFANATAQSYFCAWGVSVERNNQLPNPPRRIGANGASPPAVSARSTEQPLQNGPVGEKAHGQRNPVIDPKACGSREPSRRQPESNSATGEAETFEELRAENVRLRRLVADLLLEKQLLEDTLRRGS